jgi:hypothetical protein
VKVFFYQCRLCKKEGQIWTTDGPPAGEVRCSECWGKDVTDKALEIISETWPHPTRMQFLLEMLTKEHGFSREEPLGALPLDKTVLAALLRKRGVKFRIESEIYLDEDPRAPGGVPEVVVPEEKKP